MSEESLTAIVGANIEKCRTKAGLTQSELAEKAGVGVTFISRVERGQKLMKLQILIAGPGTTLPGCHEKGHARTRRGRFCLNGPFHPQTVVAG